MNPQERAERIEQGMRLLDEAYKRLDPIMTSGQRLLLNQFAEQMEDAKWSWN